MKWAQESGIQKTVLFAAFHSDYAAANRQVAQLVRQNPERFYGFAFVHAQRDQGRVLEMVRTAVQQYGFVGIKCHRYDARISREICDVARAFRLPVLYDVVGEISVVELLGEQYPDVNFIIPHLGSFSDDWRAQSGLIDQLVRFPNIYTDTSGVRRFDILQRALNRVGPSKFLFGSDGPWLHPGVELSKIAALHLSPEDAKLVLAGNLLRLIKQVRPEPAQPPRIAVAAEVATEWRDPWLLAKA